MVCPGYLFFMGTLQALIFDVDGTLAETERDAHLPAFNDAFCAAGLDWRWTDAEYGELLAVTGGQERIRHYCALAHPEFLERPDFATFVQRLHEDKTARYIERVNAGELPLRPGIARLIDEARTAGVRLAIATTTSPGNVTALLDRSLAPGSSAWFSVIGAGDVIRHKKPAPDIYWWVLEKLSLPPEACLAIEDSANGVRAARGANLPVAVTEAQYTRGEDFSGALAVLPDLANTDLASLRALHARHPVKQNKL